MSDVAKWAILGALIVTLIIMILTLPFGQYLNVETLKQSFTVIVNYSSSYLYSARAIINIFLPPVGRQMLSGLMLYLFFSWVIKLSIKIIAWVTHFIFK